MWRGGGLIFHPGQVGSWCETECQRSTMASEGDWVSSHQSPVIALSVPVLSLLRSELNRTRLWLWLWLCREKSSSLPLPPRHRCCIPRISQVHAISVAIGLPSVGWPTSGTESVLVAKHLCARLALLRDRSAPSPKRCRRGEVEVLKASTSKEGRETYQLLASEADKPRKRLRSTSYRDSRA